MFDYTKSIKIKNDLVTPLIRVSTIKLIGDFYTSFETFVFSDDKRQQYIHVYSNTKEQAIKKHNYIVKNLKKII